MENIIHNGCAKNPAKIIGYVIVGVILAVLFAFLFGYFVMLLWNWLMPLIFSLPEINYWQAAGIVILARLIFGGLGGSHSNSKHYKRSKWKKESLCKDEDWKYYHEFWKDRGEQAFKDYVSKRKEGNNEE